MQVAGAATAAWEVCVFLFFVALTTCAPLWRRRGGGAGAAPAGEGGKLAYVFAGGASGVGYLAMILSVARGTLGVRSFLGFPAELVYRGSAMWETLYGMCLAFPLVAYILLPLYYHMKTTSVYEYLEARFGSVSVRRCAAGTFVFRQLLNLAVTLYTPAVALHAALGVPPAAAAAVTAALAAVATLLGGLSAAIRADVIQSVTMVVVSVAFIVQATLKAGGAAQVLRDNVEGGRLQFFTFTWDPRTRVDTLSAVIGQLFMSLSVYGCQQTFVQRYLSLRSAARARRTLLAAAPAVALAFSLSWVCGLSLYALYRHCDPLAAGKMAAADELLPYYVADELAAWPGMMGLFLGTLFNGALSFLVSNVNSLATVTWEDFVSAAPAFRGASDAHQLTVIKIIGVIYTVIIMLLSLLVGKAGGVIEGSLLVTSATSGALLGVFLLAAAAPRVGARGALAGMLAAHALTGALAAGRLLRVDVAKSMLPLSTDGCTNGTLLMTPSVAPTLSALANHTLAQLAPLLREPVAAPVEPSAGWAVFQFLCDVSYMWYAVIGTAVCVGIGNVVGILLDTHTVDPALLHPWVAKYYAKSKTVPEKDVDVTQKSVTEKSATVVVLTPSQPAPPAPVPPASANRQYDAYAQETQRTRF